NQGQFLHNGQVQQHNFPNNGQFQHNGQVQQHNFPNNGQFQHNGQVQQQATPVNQGQFQYNGEVQQHNFPNNGQFQHNGQVQQQATPIDEGLHLQHNEQVNINNVNNQQIDTNTAENTEKTTPINPFGDVIINKIATQKNKNLLKNTDNKSVTQETAPVKEAAVSQEAKPETPKVEKTENVNPFGDPVFKK
ncbi:MAG: hypothetical protein Q3988_04825, partial [Gemella sp.]|nr:hypothetical protein [Gemella sp.]